MNFVVTLLGRDRLGIVESFSSAVANHGGTWCESRVLQVDDQFGGVFHAIIPAGSADQFESDLRDAFAHDFTLGVVRSGSTPASAAARSRFRVRVLCGDRQGLLHDFAQLCTAREINILELQTNLRQAPMSGLKMFEISALCEAATDVDVPAFSEAVESIDDDVVLYFSAASDVDA